jgi:hypothetical protein
MVSRRSFVIGLGVLAISAGSGRAVEQSAQDFLGGIYATYKGKDAKGIVLSEGGATARYFTPALARMIDADAKAAAKRGEVGNLDGDPFVDAQDWDISSFAIDVKDTGPDKASGTVKFRNFEKDYDVAIDLVKTKAGWRIDEISLPGRKSLRALFKKK